MDSLDQDHYSKIINHLNNNSTQLKTLNEILNSQIIDTTQSQWHNLSQALQKCMLSANKEIFLRTLEVHYRIISFTNTSMDGFVSLLKGILGLLKSSSFESNQNKILQSLKLMLHTHVAIIKILLHSSRTIIEDVIQLFIELICSKNVFELVANLDCKGNWIENFCYGSCIRDIFFSTLRQKYSGFLKAVIKKFVLFLNKDDESIIDGLNEAYFINHFLHYNYNLNFFPIIISDGEIISVEKLLEIFISKVQQAKHPEINEILVKIFLKQPKLLSPKLLDLLIDPLFLINVQNVNSSVEKHGYILQIIGNVAQSKYYRVLIENLSKIRKSRTSKFAPRNSSTLLLKLTELLLVALNSSELKDITILSLVKCLSNIYQSHSILAAHSNPSKLLKLINFYENHVKTISVELRTEILNFVSILYSNCNFVMNNQNLCKSCIINDMFAFLPRDKIQSIIICLRNDSSGLEVLRNSKIVKNYLEDIWYNEEQNGEERFNELLLFLCFVKYNTQSVVAFLYDENEQTLVENDKPVTLGGVLENALNSDQYSLTEVHLALKVIKVLMVNLDVLLYLQTNYQLQDKLNKIGSTSEEIIDELSTMKKEILVRVESIGKSSKFHQNKEGTNSLKNCLQMNGAGNDSNWITYARNAFKSSLNHPTFDALFDLLDQVPKTYVYRKIELTWPPSDSVYYKLHPENFTGISIIINCGLESGLLSEETGIENHIENLTLLMKQTRLFLNHKPENFVKFDWFVGVIFLFSGGDLDKCKQALINFANIPNVAIVWSTFADVFEDVTCEKFYQQLGIILEENCIVIPTLKAMGVSAEFIVRFWLNQSFFNLLEIQEVGNFILVTILYPMDVIVHYFNAIFNHVSKEFCNLLTHQEEGNIYHMEDLCQFKLSENIDWMELQVKQLKTVCKM